MARSAMSDIDVIPCSEKLPRHPYRKRAALLALHSEALGTNEAYLFLLDFIGNGDVLES